MKKLFFYLTAFTATFFLLSCSAPSERKSGLRLWYETPADASVKDNPDGWADDPEWLKSMPLGNGSLGAMVFGDVKKERIQLNEETLWSGSKQDNDNPEAALHLEEIRRLLNEGKYKEATELTNRTQICKGFGSGHGNGARVPFGCYQTLGDLWIDFDNKADYTDYYRELDLEKALVNISYIQDGVKYRREVFVSCPDQVTVVKISADKPKKISFNCTMDRPEYFKTRSENDQLIMQGALTDGMGGEGMKYMARLKAIAKNGTVSYSGSSLRIENADEVMLLLSASTDYLLKYPVYKGRDYINLTAQNIKNASQKTYKELYNSHVREYSSYFNRVRFTLENAVDTIPTDICIDNVRKGQISPHLYELLFQYGRYLLISSSRPGTMPANLQGIWANELQTPWNGDYHTDVNIEMNYWPAEVTNLSECHLPLFDLINSLVEPGSKTAQIQYNKKGWVIHPITNVWGYTSPGESASWGMHTGAAAWMCQHIMEHYRFTQDKDFLQKMYPTLKGAVEFYMDWLCKDPTTGKLVSGPAVSPENTFIAPDGSKSQISMGPTHDQQTIWQLFDDFEKASALLAINDTFIEKVSAAKKQLLGNQTGKDGRLMEWAKEFPEVEPGHRHISHLFALHPGSQINSIQTPELFKAVNKSLDFRVKHGVHIGWSASWGINQYARLLRPEKALESLNTLIKKNVYKNLFTKCPPFQIEANFGATSGIAEMLLQSHVYDDGAYIIQLLPALPASWKDGSFSGLKARGGFEVSATWKNGDITDASITSLKGNKCKVLYKGSYLEPNIAQGESWKWGFN